jgi:hypothetical protein
MNLPRTGGMNRDVHRLQNLRRLWHSHRHPEVPPPLRVWLPGETRETIRQTIDFAKCLDTETIQVSIAHALPGTELYDYGAWNGLITLTMADNAGHQLPNITYPGLDEVELVDAVERFYGEYYFRPRMIGAWSAKRFSILKSGTGCSRKRANISRYDPSGRTRLTPLLRGR